MFPLHETTRRKLCRACLVLFAIAPLAVVGGWGAVHRLPNRAEWTAEDLSRQLGCRATLADVTYTRPGEVRYFGLSLADGETGASIAEVDRLEITAAAAGKSGSLRFFGVRIEPTGLRPLWEMSQRLLKGQLGVESGSWRLEADQVAIMRRGEAFACQDLAGVFAIASVGAELKIQFGPNSVQSATLRVMRDRGKQPPTSGLELKSGDVALPTDLVAAVFDDAAPLVAAAEFRGDFWASESAGVWTWGVVHGQVSDLDLAALGKGLWPHMLDARADVDLSRVDFANGRPTLVDCVIKTGPGAMSRSLAAATAQELGVRWSSSVAHQETIEFGRLTMRLLADGSGVRIVSNSPDNPRGAILIAADGATPLAAASAELAPVAAMVRALASDNGQQAPTNNTALWLLEHAPRPKPQ